MWEHAYYLTYRNRRAEWLSKWWDVVNWDYIAERAGFFVPVLVAFTGQLSPKLRGDIVAFMDEHLQGEYAVPYARALETMDQRAELQARAQGDLTGWFRGKA